jgi:hypothetical protein
LVKKEIKSGKIPGNRLTDLVLALLYAVAAPHHRRHGGWCQCRPVLALASPPPPLAVPHRCVLERLPSPSPDQPAYRSTEPSDLDASPWVRRGRPCAIHGWGCPNRVTLVQGPSSSSHQGRGGRRRRRRASHHNGHRPCRGAGDSPDSTHLRRSTGPTPWTTSAMDRDHTADLTDPSRCDILTQGLIGLIKYSYHQDISSFPEAHLQKMPGLSVIGSEQF